MSNTGTQINHYIFFGLNTNSEKRLALFVQINDGLMQIADINMESNQNMLK